MPLIWDNHACLPLHPHDDAGLAYLERYRTSGVNVVTLNICWDGVSPDLAVPMADTFRSWVAKYPDRYLLVETPSDIDRARDTSRLGILFDIEGGRALQGDIGMVSRFYDLGVRWMLLTYNRRNELGGGCLDDDNGGLTDFGGAVIDEMCRVGMVPCCTHVNERSAMEVLERSTLPVIFSHSNARAIFDHPRNISDAAIRACARTGGVVGINGIGPMLGARPADTNAVLDHVCYIADLVGPEHVALGLDYCFDIGDQPTIPADQQHFIPPTLFDLESFTMLPPEQIPSLATGLHTRGWSDTNIAAFLGNNLRRVAHTAWKPRSE